MSEIDRKRLWEGAYIRQSADAALGRLFRGVVHNLNGIIQAFSMQSELIGMTLPQLQKQLAATAAAATDEEERALLEQMRTTLVSRGKLVEQMKEKVQEAQDIMRRTHLLTELADPGPEYTVGSIIRTEIEFRQAEPFFKHQVEKELKLVQVLPRVRRLAIELHQTLFALLANAADALEHRVAAPRIIIEAGVQGNCLLLAVEDNGPGIPAESLPHIFEPFFTTKSGHDGLGLYLIRKIMDDNAGEILCTSSRPGSTRFQLTVPHEKI
jgi:two-component system, NtrC family, sensor histidine kinase HupT/HoxJ